MRESFEAIRRFVLKCGIHGEHAERYAQAICEEPGRSLEGLDRDAMLAMGIRKGHVRLLLAAIQEKVHREDSERKEPDSDNITQNSGYELREAEDETARLVREDEERAERERQRFEEGLWEVEEETRQKEDRILQRSR
jgi:hypothetical protein